MVLFH